jgi:hypothetical protein
VPHSDRRRWSPFGGVLMRALLLTLSTALIPTTLTCTGMGAQLTQPDKDMAGAFGETADEMRVCSVYFRVVASCAKDNDLHDIAQKYTVGADKLADASIGILISPVVGMSQQAYLAANSLDVKAMMGAMNSNCTNISILLQRYSDFCQRLSQDATPRFKEWAACVRAKQRPCRGGLAN